MAREYDVKGSNSFLIWSVGLALLCIWALRDGWFPSESKILKHGPPDSPNAGDSFYLFNQSLTYLAGIGAVICGIMHKVVK